MSSITDSHVNVKVTPVSGHSMYHRNTLTAKVGTLIPVLVEEVCPNSRMHLQTSFSVKLPPLASETFANIDYRLEAFFVPHRLLCNSATPIICGQNRLREGLQEGAQYYFPVFQLNTDDQPTLNKLFNKFKPGTLSDYLGFRGYTLNVFQPNEDIYLPVLPYYAYHLIWDYWYRNKLVQKSLYDENFSTLNSSPFALSPMKTFNQNQYLFDLSDVLDSASFADGSNIFDLRQRNFDSDYFTTATLSPQLGVAQSVKLPVQNTQGTMSIASLRAANSLQQFAERNNLAGIDDVNYYKAMYGAHLDYGVAQHPVCLGSVSLPIYVNGIFQNGENTQQTNNPFMSVASQYGSAGVNETSVVIKDFTANEFGYIFVLGSLVPRVSYSSGTRRYLSHHLLGNNTGADFANPLLQNVGPQPVYNWEFEQTTPFSKDGTMFGYQTRFAEWMSHPDEVHGEFVDGRSLDSFVLQRSFNYSVAGISSSFLQIPTNYLDQIFAVTPQQDTGFSYWVDMLHKWNVSSPLQDFVIPSLQNPAYEHGQDVNIRKNGAPMID